MDANYQTGQILETISKPNLMSLGLEKCYALQKENQHNS